MTHRSSERGNALWFILIVIVLLGGLTILLTRSGSTVDQSGDVEQMRIRASQVLRYAKSLQSAVDQMRGRGVSENEISFANAETATDYTNARCTRTDCLVFDVGGGGQTYRAPPEGANDGSDWIFTSGNNIGTDAGPVGTTAARTGNDLIILMAQANNSLCIEINKELNIGTPGIIPVETSSTQTDPFTGNYDNILKTISGDPAPLELNRHEAGCYNQGGINYFYFVLLAR